MLEFRFSHNNLIEFGACLLTHSKSFMVKKYYFKQSAAVSSRVLPQMTAHFSQNKVSKIYWNRYKNWILGWNPLTFDKKHIIIKICWGYWLQETLDARLNSTFLPQVHSSQASSMSITCKPTSSIKFNFFSRSIKFYLQRIRFGTMYLCRNGTHINLQI